MSGSVVAAIATPKDRRHNELCMAAHMVGANTAELLPRRILDRCFVTLNRCININTCVDGDVRHCACTATPDVCLYTNTSWTEIKTTES